MKIKETAEKAFSLLNRNNFQEAEFYLMKLVKKSPANTDFINALAFAKINLNKKEESISLLEKSVMINSKQPQIFYNISLGYIELNQLNEALRCIDKAIKLNPDNSHFYFAKAKIFSGLTKYDEAEENYLKAIKFDQEFYDAYLNLGYVYNLKKDYINGVKVLEKLISLNSEFPNAHYNLAIIHDNQKNYDKAIFYYKKTIELDNNNYIAHYNLSILLLYKGMFEEGWQEFEYRLHQSQKHKTFGALVECNNLEKAKNLIIWGEQGIGDQILYSSMLKDLNFISNLTVALDHRLIPIYERSFPEINFKDLSKLDNLDNFDCQLAIGSLGKFLRKTKESFNKQRRSFLVSNEKIGKELEKKLSPKKKILIGIAWKSNNEKIGHFKSIKLKEFNPLFKLPDIDFVNLQYGDTENEINQIEKETSIRIHNINELDKFNDLEGLFSLVDLCDIVVTSSNVTAHIAGALGKSTFLIIPNLYGAAWYWHDESLSGWYPSISIYKQSSNGEWSVPINLIKQEINKQYN